MGRQNIPSWFTSSKALIFMILFVITIGLGTYDFLINHYENIFLPDKSFTNDYESKIISNLDINSLIKIYNENDIITKRNSLIEFIWQNKGFPINKMPDTIQNNISDPNYNDLDNLKQIDKIEVGMEYGINSIAYHFIPKLGNNNLVVYHQGHAGDFIFGKNTINFLLKEGYSVIAFSMPLNGFNNQPEIDLKNIGTIKLVSHKQFPLLESSNFQPIKFFVEPIAVSLNYLDEKYDYNSYNMIGLSGGGWTTVLYSAIDERISQSFSVAGSYPLFLRFEQKNISHYEEILPELYNIANYLELYILASYGEERDFIQIYNKYDRCCYSGDLYKTYENHLKEKMDVLQKGSYDVFLDDTHKEHKISKYTLDIINNIMN